jgi:alpha-galactosidase
MKKLVISLILSKSVSSLNNGLGIVPQMGWNTWNKFGCEINEDLIKQTADQLVQIGLVGVGYKYLNLDDCWMQEKRDSNGHI